MKVLKSMFIISLVVFIQLGGLFAQGVVISDDAGASTIADESAVLDIQSTSKGMLIPRLTTVQRNAISNAKDGLLVFDVTEGSFYLFGQSKWTDLSTPAKLWTVEDSQVRLTNSSYNLQVGNSVTASNMVVQADADAASTDPIFEIKDKDGNAVLSVTSEGVRININDDAKNNRGSFSVGRITGGVDEVYFSVNKDDGTNVYATATAGGFAVGRYATAKGMSEKFFSVDNKANTHVYPGIAGGFAVGRYATAKAGIDTLYFTVKKDEGTRVYTSGLASTVEAGGFAVGRYATAKGMDTLLLSVKYGEGTRVYTSGAVSTVEAGGFAVGRYATAKGMGEQFFNVNENSGTNVYTFENEQGVERGGFTVGHYDTAKGMGDLLFTVAGTDGTRVFLTDYGGLAVGSNPVYDGAMHSTYFSVDSTKTTVSYSGDGAGKGFFVQKLWEPYVGTVFNVRKDYFNVGYTGKTASNTNFRFSFGNTKTPQPDIVSPIMGNLINPANEVVFHSGITLGEHYLGTKYSFPETAYGIGSGKVLKLDVNGYYLEWQDDDIDNSKKNNSNLKEELENLKKENSQLRKDIEEIKELLKK